MSFRTSSQSVLQLIAAGDRLFPIIMLTLSIVLKSVCTNFLLLLWQTQSWWLKTMPSFSAGGWKSEMGLIGLNSRCWQGCTPPGGSRKESVPSGFPGSRVCSCSLASGHLHLQCQQWTIKSLSDNIILNCILLPLSSIYPCESIRPVWIIKDNLPTLRSDN